jgi:hypothetical protein
MAGLYDTPVGALDPRSLALMQAGFGMMQASGPSLTPVSLGQVLGQGGQRGIQAFQQAQEARQQDALRQLKVRQIEEEMRLAREKAMQPPRPFVASPGAQIIGQNGEVIHTVPFKPEPQSPIAPPPTRRLRIGNDDVTQEFVNGEWREVGRGAAFAPKGSVSEASTLPKPPTGFRWNADSTGLEPIPGGPKDTSGKDAARAQGAVQKADTVIQKVDEALNQIGALSTGLVGSVLGAVPGTKAYDLDKTIDTIKANLGFSELQAMREASPTGGALGQVAVQELNMLQSTVASLDKGQSRENLERALQQVRTHFQNWKNAVQQAQAGQQADAPAPSAAPAPGMTSRPPASKHKGKIIEDSKGNRYKSDGMSWRPL